MPCDPPWRILLLRGCQWAGHQASLEMTIERNVEQWFIHAFRHLLRSTSIILLIASTSVSPPFDPVLALDRARQVVLIIQSPLSKSYFDLVFIAGPCGSLGAPASEVILDA